MPKKGRFDFTKKNKRSGKIENVGYLDLEQDEEQSRCSLYFYGDIVSATWESMWYEEDRCPQDIADFLNQLDGYEDIDIYFNSGGGDVFAGLTIYNQLKRYDGHKVGYVDGMAASIASVIMFACDELHFATGAQAMIHKPLCMAYGNADDFKAVIKQLNLCEDSILDVYMEHVQEGVTRDKIQSLMSNETWFDSKKMQQYFNVEIEEKAAVAACASDYFEKYNNIPETLKGTETENIVDAVLAELEKRSNAAAQGDSRRFIPLRYVRNGGQKVMNKELQKLLKQINDKKNEVKSLVNDGKLDKAKAAKEELKELQNRFDLLYDLDEDEQDGIEDKVNKGTAKQVGGEKKVDKKNLVKAFVNIVKAGFLHREADEADVEVYKNALTSDTTAGSEGEVGIGVTIPEDIRTDIIELRRSSDNLEQYVNVEGVVTKTGTRNIEVDAESTPFDNVDEAADFPEMDEPEFLPIEYKVKKKGGILKMTAELLEDTAANIMAYINKWIAKKTKATRNAMILKVLNEMTKGKEVTVENLDSLKDIFNEQLDPAIAESSIVITNQSGFNYLDKLKDKDGNYILQKDPTQQTKGKMLFGEYRIVKLSKKTLKSTPIMNSDGHTIDGYKHPVFCGDLKEAITLFDRNVLTIDLNDKGAGLWDKDMTGLKVRDRFDVQAVDKDAVIKGEITEVVNG